MTHSSDRCSICGEPILPGQSAALSQGVLAHRGCPEHRKSPTRLIGRGAPNERDRYGNLTCPVCQEPLRRGQSIEITHDVMAHARCIS
ncbi:MAG: hypothetical protein ACREJ4_00925 [Candidatus Methylomirabilaceae bacterium]